MRGNYGSVDDCEYPLLRKVHNVPKSMFMTVVATATVVAIITFLLSYSRPVVVHVHTTDPNLIVTSSNVVLKKTDNKEEGKGKKNYLPHPIKEAFFWELFPGHKSDSRFEASGVCYMHDDFYVVFDNWHGIARVPSDLFKHSATNELKAKENASDYEGVACHAGHKNIYVVEEAHQQSKYKKEFFQPAIHTYDGESLTEHNVSHVNFDFKNQNSGLEGIEFVWRRDTKYLLGLCEGNHCDQKTADVAGNGRIVVLYQNGTMWEHEATIPLPRKADFVDYADMNVDEDGTIAVVSQESSAVWIGKLSKRGWILEDEGEVYHFPLDKDGDVVYCNVEGIAWMNKEKFAIVSDKPKSTQDKKCANKQMSISIFNHPAHAGHPN